MRSIDVNTYLKKPIFMKLELQVPPLKNEAVELSEKLVFESAQKMIFTGVDEIRFLNRD